MPSGTDPQKAKTAGDVATLARAIRRVADMPGVRVINISSPTASPSTKRSIAALGAAVRYAAVDKDQVIVARPATPGEQLRLQPADRPEQPWRSRNWAGATTISTPPIGSPTCCRWGR